MRLYSYLAWPHQIGKPASIVFASSSILHIEFDECIVILRSNQSNNIQNIYGYIMKIASWFHIARPDYVHATNDLYNYYISEWKIRLIGHICCLERDLITYKNKHVENIGAK